MNNLSLNKFSHIGHLGESVKLNFGDSVFDTVLMSCLQVNPFLVKWRCRSKSREFFSSALVVIAQRIELDGHLYCQFFLLKTNLTSRLVGVRPTSEVCGLLSRAAVMIPRPICAHWAS